MRLVLVASTCLAALALTGAAAAGTPRLALFDLQTDLAQASRNAFGDVQVSKARSALAARAKGAALVQCAGICTYGRGWLAFTRPPALAPADVAGAKAEAVRGQNWRVTLDLTPRGASRWTAFSGRTAKAGARRGVPDALVLAVDGSVAAQPLANQIVRKGSSLVISGLSRADALRTAKALQ
jgi:hypothetical protein